MNLFNCCQTPELHKFLICAAGLKLMLVLLLRGKSAADMAFCLINVQNHSGLGGQGRINAFQAVCYVCWCPIRNKKF